MSATLAWALFALAAYVVVSTVTGLIVGPLLAASRRCAVLVCPRCGAVRAGG